MKQLVFVCALLVLGVAMGDAVEYFEKIKTMNKNAPHSNAKVQELDGVTGNEIGDVAHKRSSEGPEEEALGHLRNGVKYYSETILHVGMTVGEGMLKPITTNLKPGTKRMPNKVR